jgi:hypothetical protein
MGGEVIEVLVGHAAVLPGEDHQPGGIPALEGGLSDQLRGELIEKVAGFHALSVLLFPVVIYYWGNLIIPPVIKDFKAVLLAPYGATAKHGTYYDRKFTFFKWDTMISLPQ